MVVDDPCFKLILPPRPEDQGDLCVKGYELADREIEVEVTK